jgi:hypothetical protein
MKEINEIRDFLYETMLTLQALEAVSKQDHSKKIEEYQNQLENANKVSAKLQGAIDIFNSIKEVK